MKKVICRTAAGKRYQVTMILLPDKTERSYELVSKSKNLDDFSLADQHIFRNMESDLSGLPADFTDLEDELNKI